MLQSVVSGLHAYVGTIGTNNSVASFDLDWTIVRNIRGMFPKDEHDWSFLPNRIAVLRYYQESGYTIFIFTNQGYKGTNMTISIDRINNIIGSLLVENLNPWVFAATGPNSSYRKPLTGMWQVFSQYQPTLDKNLSLFVGDAAGRPQDHSSDDRDFATAVGVKFYTPEEIFPNVCLRVSNTIRSNYQISIPGTQTMFIFVGMPGSGKTTFYQEKLAPKGWVHVNQDTVKTQAKVLNAIRTALTSKQSVAVDATNPGHNKRLEYLTLASQYKVPTMILYFVSNGQGWNKLRANPVPTIAYSMYYKNLIEPTPELDYVPVVEIA